MTIEKAVSVLEKMMLEARPNSEQAATLRFVINMLRGDDQIVEIFVGKNREHVGTTSLRSDNDIMRNQ